MMIYTNFAPQVDLDEAASSKYADAEGLVTKAEFVRLGKNDLTNRFNLIDSMFSNRKTFVSLICEQRVLLQTLFQNRCKETLFHQLGKKLVRDYLFLATES